MTSPREAALAPLSRIDAERLLPELSTGRQTLERRVLDRASLAARLGVSPNTLRVHLTRIRAKLDVAEKRGDKVLLQAALSQRPL